MRKTHTLIEMPVPKAKSELLVAPVAMETKAKKPNSAPISPNKSESMTPKPITVTPEMTLPEHVGLSAGSIWHYLAKNGATPAEKLLVSFRKTKKSFSEVSTG